MFEEQKIFYEKYPNKQLCLFKLLRYYVKFFIYRQFKPVFH